MTQNLTVERDPTIPATQVAADPAKAIQRADFRGQATAARSEPPAPPSLRLPRHLASMLVDPIDHQTGKPAPGLWSMPDPLPSKLEIQQALASVRAHLQPASPDFVRQRVAMLRLVTRAPSTDGMTEAQFDAFVRAQIGEYARLLADYPADLWSRACDALPLEKEWFPMVADFQRVMRPEMEKRRAALSRLERMLAAHDRPAAERFVPEPREVRLRAVADSYARQFGPDHPKAVEARAALESLAA